jgi:nucleoid DNA-binding protein
MSKGRRGKIEIQLTREIAKDLGATLSEVQSIVESQFLYVRKIMEHGAFETVRLPYLGKFTVSVKRVQLLNDRLAVIQRGKFQDNT